MPFDISTIDPSKFHDEEVRALVIGFLNFVQEQAKVIADLRSENQRLKDELARLKGEQGKPNVLPNRPTKPPKIDSEKERNEPKKEKPKRKPIKIDHTKFAAIDRSTLPNDAVYKGYENFTVQDLEIRTNNTLIRRERFYSPSQNATFLAPLPNGLDHPFGATLRALCLDLYYDKGMTEPKILEWLEDQNIQMSAGALSNILIKHIVDFHKEKDAVFCAGLEVSPWQQTDDTSTRVNGQNWHCHVLGNPLYTAYFTRPSKDRATILDILRGPLDASYRVNAETIALATQAKVSQKNIAALMKLPWDQELAMSEFFKALREHLPGLTEAQEERIGEAAEIAAYHAQIGFPVIRLLLSDDAGQSDKITQEHALCWVHEGRLYKKLVPCLPAFAKEREDFLTQLWAYYKELLRYKKNPSKGELKRLLARFDQLFPEKPTYAYAELNDRILKTRAKKTELLMVLAHPEIPLHNNASELAARARVRKRDVSFGPRSDQGVEAWDTFQSLCATAKKLGIRFYDYVKDRVGKEGKIPNLAEIIREKAKALNLGGSWPKAVPV